MGFYIDMIDVNQGDSFLLTLDNSTDTDYVLIDGGPASTGGQLVQHLMNITQGKIHMVVATHIDNDHIGGLKEIVKNFEVEQFVINEPGNLKDWIGARESFKRLGEKVVPLRKLVENLSTAEDLLNLVSEYHIPITTAYAGKSWRQGEDIELRVLNPTEARLNAAWADEILQSTIREPIMEDIKAPQTSPRNNAGIVLDLVYKGLPYAIFTADVGAGVLHDIVGSNSYKFLKIPHHGSKTGLDKEFVKNISPESAYLSVGDNSFGHPSTEVLDIFKEANIRVYCTNRTKYCRKDCDYSGFGNLCHKHEKESRPGWNTVDAKKCANNK